MRHNEPLLLRIKGAIMKQAHGMDRLVECNDGKVDGEVVKALALDAVAHVIEGELEALHDRGQGVGGFEQDDLGGGEGQEDEGER